MYDFRINAVFRAENRLRQSLRSLTGGMVCGLTALIRKA